MHFRIDDLNLVIHLDVARSENTGALYINDDLLGVVGEHLHGKALQVEDDLSHVLLHAGNSRELMLHTFDVYRGDRHARKGGQQHTTQAVAQGVTEAALQGFHNKLAIAVVLANLYAFDACLFDFYDHFVYPPQSDPG